MVRVQAKIYGDTWSGFPITSETEAGLIRNYLHGMGIPAETQRLDGVDEDNQPRWVKYER